MYLIPFELVVHLNNIPGLIRSLLVSDSSTLNLARTSFHFSVLPLTFSLLLIISLQLYCSKEYKIHCACWHCTYMMLYICLFIYLFQWLRIYSAKLCDDWWVTNWKGCRRKQSCILPYLSHRKKFHEWYRIWHWRLHPVCLLLHLLPVLSGLYRQLQSTCH